jgi:hypothetical protein
MIREDQKIHFKTNFYSKEKIIEFSERGIGLHAEKKLVCWFDKDTISDFRYGINWIRGIEFTVGRLYCIDVRNKKNDIIKIRLRSLYGINKRKLHRKYYELINYLYDYCFEEMIFQMISSIENGEAVNVAGAVFSKEGVGFNCSGIYKLVLWDDLDTHSYFNYYALSSKEEPGFYKAFTYLTDWNAGVVYSLSRQILKNKGLYTE